MCNDPIQQQHDFPHKPALDIFRSRCTPLRLILKADPSLEGDIADPSACHQLGSIFKGRLAPWTTNMCLYRQGSGLEKAEKVNNLRDPIVMGGKPTLWFAPSSTF